MRISPLVGHGEIKRIIACDSAPLINYCDMVRDFSCTYDQRPGARTLRRCCFGRCIYPYGVAPP